MSQHTMTIDATEPVAVSCKRWGLASAAFGGAAWLLAPSKGPLVGSLEHFLLFMPLVGVPLGMLLHARLTAPGSAHQRPRLVQWLQPFAALLVLAAFSMPKGAIAAAFIGLWGVMAVLFLATGSFRSGLNVAAAQIFMPIGALWLIFNRLGAHPAGLSDERVLLAALHFQFSGFAAQLIAAATLHKSSHRWIQIALISGIPLIAMGNIAAVPLLRVVGASTVIAGTLALAAVLIATAPNTPLKIAGFSLLGAIALALAYTVGNFIEALAIDVSLMAKTHGALNALGFTLFGLLGHLRKAC